MGQVRRNTFEPVEKATNQTQGERFKSPSYQLKNSLQIEKGRLLEIAIFQWKI